ncbi:MAG: transposase [Sedimentisphaerales bacterium]|nr:transposase [Sedimentisphaerales bacterium]
MSLVREWCQRCGVDIWAYCLMPNHIHLIVVPSSEYGRGGCQSYAQPGHRRAQPAGVLELHRGC